MNYSQIIKENFPNEIHRINFKETTKINRTKSTALFISLTTAYEGIADKVKSLVSPCPWVCECPSLMKGRTRDFGF